MPGTSTEQVVDKGIRQKSTKEWTHSLTAVPFVRGHRSVFPRTPRNTGVYTRHTTFVTATSGVLTRLPAKLSKNGMHVYTLSDRRSETKLRVYTASEAKGLTKEITHFGGLYLQDSNSFRVPEKLWSLQDQLEGFLLLQYLWQQQSFWILCTVGDTQQPIL